MDYLKGKLFFIVIPIALLGFIILDKILRYQYTNHNDIWMKDGNPSGVFWHPEGSSTFTRTRTIFKLLFRTPEWIRNNKEISFYLLLFRILNISACAMIVAYVVMF